jgi:hypothetical protein
LRRVRRWPAPARRAIEADFVTESAEPGNGKRGIDKLPYESNAPV